MSRSRFVGSVRVTIVAIVSQPRPRTIGITALPLRPILLNILSINMARRGRYPVSSMIAKTRKKNDTSGRISATA